MLDFGYYNLDCTEGMKQFPDNYFDLAIVDPPYGIGEDWKKRNKGNVFTETSYKNENISGNEYFEELKRISKNQIICGYNYYTDILGPTNYLIIWDKGCGDNQVIKYSKCEIAYTSIRMPCNIARVLWDGYRMEKGNKIKKIHPHQKPVALYVWLLQKYAKKGDKILDTHVGSASSLIACHKMGFDYVGFELDKLYYDHSVKRLKEELSQVNMFVDVN